jgi:hypothetical protein
MGHRFYPKHGNVQPPVVPSVRWLPRWFWIIYWRFKARSDDQFCIWAKSCEGEGWYCEDDMGGTKYTDDPTKAEVYYVYELLQYLRGTYVHKTPVRLVRMKYDRNP